MAESKENRILVAGDVCLDVLSVPMPGTCSLSNGLNWRLNGGLQTHYIPGGAMLLARFVFCAVGYPVAGPVLPLPEALIKNAKDSSPLTDSLLERLTRQDVVHSMLSLCSETTGQGKEKKTQWRMFQLNGFSGPDEGAPDSSPQLQGDQPDIDMIILDDSGNGFRQNEPLWPLALREDRTPACVVHKLHRPLPGVGSDEKGKTCENALWQRVQSNHKEQSVVIIDVNDLRMAGAAISRGLSWEKTALEILWQLRGDTRFSALRDCRHLIIRLGLDGALCYHNFGHEKPPEVRLIYDPQSVEDGFVGGRKSGMVGLGSAFTAWLSASIYTHAPEAWRTTSKTEKDRETEQIVALSAAVRFGLTAARRLFLAGFGSADRAPAYPGSEAFSDLEKEAALFGEISVPVFSHATESDPYKWTILDTLFPAGSKLEEVSEKSLKQDKVKELVPVPMGIFKKLRTYDRFEIEAYRSICTIMREYLENPAPKRPLSIAVFGPPGSGKSFGVQQVADYIKGDIELDMLPPFNLSQFHDADELTAAFHVIRDSSVRGRVPLVFFDEFDTDKLIWLKHFLAPMQDGLFMDRGTMHPIGKAIFIFAGGTSSRFADFSVSPDTSPRDTQLSFKEFKSAKGPDFASRLRAQLDIIGIEHSGLPKASALLRRASVLRFQLKEKASGAFDLNGNLQIDNGLVNALLRTPQYRHGVRSMESILDMSRLSGCRRLGPSCLPPKEQLELHINADEFSRLIFEPSSFDADTLEIIAKEIHKDYILQRKADETFRLEEPSHKPWDQLEEEYRESNREQARMIPIRLRTIGLHIRKSGNAPAKTALTPDQITTLARQEHERWMTEKLRKGWGYGEARDNNRRIHPSLVPWEDERLTEAEKKKDIDAVCSIPLYLAAAGYEVIKSG